MTKHETKHETLYPSQDQPQYAWRRVPLSNNPTTLTPASQFDNPSLFAPGVKYVLTYSRNPLNGKPRYLGTPNGFIGADLRMHVMVDTRDEVRMGWEKSYGPPTGCEPHDVESTIYP